MGSQQPEPMGREARLERRVTGLQSSEAEPQIPLIENYISPGVF